MPKLYAVLVAIDKYPGLPQDALLYEAEKDVDSLNAFLLNHSTSEPAEIRLLKGSDATKVNVRKAFSLFRKASGQDVCLYYFSGHGCQLKSLPPEIAQLENNSITPEIESTILFDSRQNNQIDDLPDKVLGHWINSAMAGKQFSGIGHFVAILDCCHSGHGTRLEEQESNLVTKAVSPYGGDIPLSLFEGYRSGDYSYGKILNEPFIQLAAAGENKTASDGAFTYALLETLKHQGIKSSYGNLMRAISNSAIGDQSPNYYVNSHSVGNLPFLGGLLR